MEVEDITRVVLLSEVERVYDNYLVLKQDHKEDTSLHEYVHVSLHVCV